MARLNNRVTRLTEVDNSLLLVIMIRKVIMKTIVIMRIIDGVRWEAN